MYGKTVFSRVLESLLLASLARQSPTETTWWPAGKSAGPRVTGGRLPPDVNGCFGERPLLRVVGGRKSVPHASTGWLLCLMWERWLLFSPFFQTTSFLWLKLCRCPWMSDLCPWGAGKQLSPVQRSGLAVHVLSRGLVERLIGFSYVATGLCIHSTVDSSTASLCVCPAVCPVSGTPVGRGMLMFWCGASFFWSAWFFFFYIFNGDPVWAATCFKRTPDVLFLLFFVTIFGGTASPLVQGSDDIRPMM